MKEIKNILVVEDQRAPLEAIEFALKDSLPALRIEARISFVINFDAAKLAIESGEEFQLILLDHRMPRRDVGNLEEEDFSKFSKRLEDIGYGLIPLIRAEQPECRV